MAGERDIIDPHLPCELYPPPWPWWLLRVLAPYAHLEGVTMSVTRWQVRPPTRYRLMVPDTDLGKAALNGKMSGEMCRIGPWVRSVLHGRREGLIAPTDASDGADDAG